MLTICAILALVSDAKKKNEEVKDFFQKLTVNVSMFKGIVTLKGEPVHGVTLGRRTTLTG